MPPKFTITRSRCRACDYMGDWPPPGDVCPNCGEKQASDPANMIEIPLAFNVAVCETCKVPAQGGRCPSCGKDMDGVEPNIETRARVKALRPLLSRADELVSSFEGFPDPHIAVTAAQAASLVTDARLFDRALELVGFAGRISEFNLSDPAVIGRETRPRLELLLDEVASVRDEAKLLAAFRPQGSLAELPRAVTTLISRAARVVAATIDAISSETIDECRAACDRLQDELPFALRAVGLACEDVTTAVVTHLHPDHFHGAIHLSTSVLVNEAEWADAMSFRGRVQQRLTGVPLPGGIDFRPVALDSGAFGAFAASRRLTSDGRVLLVSTPGHTRGHTSVVAIDDDGRHVLLAGDTTDTLEQLHARRPDAITPDPDLQTQTIDRILAHSAEHPTVYLPTHDPDAVTRHEAGTTLS